MSDGFYWVREAGGPWFIMEFREETWYNPTWVPNDEPAKFQVGMKVREPK